VPVYRFVGTMAEPSPLTLLAGYGKTDGEYSDK
jgi:hypothetical protein